MAGFNLYFPHLVRHPVGPRQPLIGTDPPLEAQFRQLGEVILIFYGKTDALAGPWRRSSAPTTPPSSGRANAPRIVGKFDDNGKRVALTVKKGDKVLIGKYAGTEIKIDDIEYLILREDEVLAIVDAK